MWDLLKSLFRTSYHREARFEKWCAEVYEG